MKRTCASLVLFLFLTLQSIAAQDSVKTEVASRSPFARGAFMLAGSFSFNRSSYPADEITMSTLTAAPSFLIFATDQIAIGGQIAYTSLYNKSRFSESTVSMTTIGPLLRFYPFNSDPILFIYAGLTVKEAYNKSGPFPSIASTSESVHAGFGFDFVNGSMFAVEPFVEYTWYGLEQSSDSNGLTFGVTFVSFHP